MPKPRKLNLETLPPASAPDPEATLSLPSGPGLSLGYRRNEGPGTWSVIAATAAARSG